MKVICAMCDNLTEIKEKTICPNCHPDCKHDDICPCYILFPNWFEGSFLEVKDDRTT